MSGTRPPEAQAKSVQLELRGVRRDLAAARDEQLLRAVALVDALPERGDADALVAPFRERLAVLRPRRPADFTRLIFMPLDPLIVAPVAWRRGAQTVPRHTLAPLAALVRAGLGPYAAEIEAALKQQTSAAARDTSAAQQSGALLGRIGLQVWPLAARILAAATVPATWRAETSIPDEDFAPLARLLAALLGMACDRQVLIDQINRDGAADRTQFARAVAASMNAPSDVADMATGLLLIGLPRPDLILRAMDGHAELAGGGAPALTERAIDLALRRTSDVDGASSVASLRGSADFLKALESRPAPGVERRALIQQLRESVDTACRSKFTSLAQGPLLTQLKAMGEAASDVQIAGLESTARGLRELEAIGREVGRAATYRDLLEITLASVLASPALTRADRVRMTELLAHTPAALALMKAAGGAAKSR